VEKNPNAVLPSLSTQEMKNKEDATEHAATLYYEKKLECKAKGKNVPQGFTDSCIDEATKKYNVGHLKRIKKDTIKTRAKKRPKYSETTDDESFLVVS
jgi:rRNA-processing protein FCF1